MNKVITQLKIDKERYEFEKLYKSGNITEKDLIRIMNEDVNYGITFSDKKYTKKELYFKKVFRSPFLLCDQDVSNNIKILLPLFIKKIFELELSELDYKLSKLDITKEEYEQRVEYLYFIMYESSEDGKNIAKNGKACGIKENFLKY